MTVDDSGLVDTFSRYYDDLSYGIPHTTLGKFNNAYTCAVYPVTKPEFTVLKVNCSQPIYGQFVTVQVYDRFDSLQFCEMKIYGTGKRHIQTIQTATNSVVTKCFDV